MLFNFTRASPGTWKFTILIYISLKEIGINILLFELNKSNSSIQKFTIISSNHNLGNKLQRMSQAEFHLNFLNRMDAYMS